MTFPFTIELFGLHISAHLLFESLAYTIGFQYYIWLRRRWNTPVIPFEQNVWVIAGAILGALIGSKVLSWLDAPAMYWAQRANPANWLLGKTIVGGFIGAWFGVELAKKFVGVRHSTGDPMIYPVIAGTVVGRVGCFLDGLQDQTYGTATGLPWGVDFGDHVIRHPTQLYEIAFVLLAGGVLFFIKRRKPNGWLFRAYMCAYFTFRFFVEFIKPRQTPYLGLSGIQVAAALAGAWCAWSAWRLTRKDA